jgi:hypothetical protein
VLERKRRPQALAGDDGSFAIMRDELLIRTLGPGWSDPQAAMAAYQRHNAQVREQCPPERLVEWTPADGWAPICQALGMPVPGDPFPQTNSSDEFHARSGSSRVAGRPAAGEDTVSDGQTADVGA